MKGYLLESKKRTFTGEEINDFFLRDIYAETFMPPFIQVVIPRPS